MTDVWQPGVPVMAVRRINGINDIEPGTLGVLVWAEPERNRACVAWENVGERHNVPLDALVRTRIRRDEDAA